MDIKKLREEILKQIELLPKEQKEILKEKIESMSDEELINFIKFKHQSQCFFCEVANKNIETFVVYENNFFIAFLDIYPAVFGQILIITKNHKQRFSDFTKEEIESFFEVLKNLIYCFYEIGFEGYNLLINEGKIAGQNFDHFCCYLFPRKENDGFSIEWKRREENKEELRKFSTLIREKIEKKKEKLKLKEENNEFKFLKERKP